MAQKSPSIDSVSALLKSSADPLRLGILKVLEKGSFGVLELAHIFDSTQSGMSHHLKLLAKAELVATRREGNSVFYRRALMDSDQPTAGIRQAIFSSLADTSLEEKHQSRIDSVYLDRESTSKQFFQAHAKGLIEQEDLIAPFEVYGKPLAEIISNLSFPETKQALEIGPGRGEFLPTLGGHFDSVTALDNSADMLTLAHAFAEQKKLGNVQFICDDTQWCRQTKQRFDCVVTNMVLHHTPSPEQFMLDVGSVVNTGGSFLLTEVCGHNEETAKTMCGDLWLGFDAPELIHWASLAKLEHKMDAYIALRNGFQIQIHQFIKVS